MRTHFKQNILITAILYTALVFLSEKTFGNPDFPVHFWEFIAIPAWKWSVPVHLSGFLWIVFWNVKLKDKPIGWPVFASLVFFFTAELLNKYLYHFFIYSRQPLGEGFSFWVVIGLYAGLCTVCSLLLRRFADQRFL